MTVEGLARARRTNNRICLLAGTLLLGSMCFGTAAASEPLTCNVPPYMAKSGKHHFHPTVRLFVYRRDPKSQSSVHDVVRMISPGSGLGVESQVRTAASDDSRTMYRAIHVHEESGSIHVEPVSGPPLTLCNFVALWFATPRGENELKEFLSSSTVHVRIGDAYFKDMSRQDVLRIILNRNVRISIFVEEKSEI